MSRHLWQIINLILGISISPVMYADVDAERELLSNIIHELQAVESLIDKAQAQSEEDTRIRFEYRWLREDLGLIKNGIQSHINTPRGQPRSFPPLRGDYRR
ncbi:MAG: conjugal transfer protein [Cellvibrionales bacterium]|nr:MAG: conjugal transfer protein [Cellvibrionales bacterium]